MRLSFFMTEAKMDDLSVKREEKGQSLVELALIVVVILVLLAGIVDLGRVLFYYQSMRDASQEAVAYASAFPLDNTYQANCQAIIARVYDNVPDISSVTVQINGDTCAAHSAKVIEEACTGNQVSVTVAKAGYPLIMPLIGQFIGQAINLSATATATIIQPMCP
jgi:Flp pilus assembly protein TadG